MMNYVELARVLKRPPAAYANVRGQGEYAHIKANVYFYKLMGKVFVMVDAQGLPQKAGECGSGVFGFHIQMKTSTHLLNQLFSITAYTYIYVRR